MGAAKTSGEGESQEEHYGCAKQKSKKPKKKKINVLKKPR